MPRSNVPSHLQYKGHINTHNSTSFFINFLKIYKEQKLKAFLPYICSFFPLMSKVFLRRMHDYFYSISNK